MQRSIHGGVNPVFRENSLLKRLNVIYFVFQDIAFSLSLAASVFGRLRRLFPCSLSRLLTPPRFYSLWLFIAPVKLLLFDVCFTLIFLHQTLSFSINLVCWLCRQWVCVSFMPFSITLTHASKTLNAYTMRYKTPSTRLKKEARKNELDGNNDCSHTVSCTHTHTHTLTCTQTVPKEKRQRISSKKKDNGT